MTLIPSLTTWNDGQVLYGSALNANFASIRDTVNTTGAFIDVARTWTVAQTFNAGITATTVSGTTSVTTPVVNIDERVQWGATNQGFTARSIYWSTANGLVIAGGAGSAYDLLLATQTGTGALAVKAGAADETHLLLYDVTAATIKRVKRGAANSGGTGLRALCIDN